MDTVSMPNAISVTLEDLETGIAKYVEKLIFMISLAAIRDIAKKLGKETGSVQIKVVSMLIGAEASTAMKKDAMKHSLEPGIVRIAPNQILKATTMATFAKIMMI